MQLFAALDRMWGKSRCGLSLCRAYYAEHPVMAEEVAEESGISGDTARRTIKQLVNINRVELVQEGRRELFVAKQEWADKTFDLIGECFTSLSPGASPTS
jgi:DNA-binding transcriptional regulator GbsR (MarR family)